MDSYEISDRVVDALDAKVPLIDDKYGGRGVNIHAIVKATLEVLADGGYIDLEEGQIDD